MQIRPTTDIWAFGVLAHLVPTGSFPLPGGTPTARRDAGVRYARGEEELRLSPELLAAWRRIVTDCLARTHEERASHDAASLLLRASEAAEGLLPRRRRVRRPLLAAAAGVLALAVAGLGIRILLDEDPATKPPARTNAGAGADASAGRSPGAERTAAGYDCCGPGNVCFFSGADGGGEMCAWEGDDPDWADGQNDCSWARTSSAGSSYNNGVADPKGFNHVTYFAEAGLRKRLGCIERGQRRNLTLMSSVRSHTWAKTCSL
ncbi:peptidase inhibitor family I36 protein [Streptomyces sp. BE230]|uniref:peptidase inhibitor family I36 protein n=1 Tax=Streptomyces sp. BE230 TaxID=3002526 RepID=UPI002ED3D2A8|nr:peptidase inhibitor family I36 protein [Streptomyces sp. BE230]